MLSMWSSPKKLLIQSSRPEDTMKNDDSDSSIATMRNVRTIV